MALPLGAWLDASTAGCVLRRKPQKDLLDRHRWHDVKRLFESLLQFCGTTKRTLIEGLTVARLDRKLSIDQFISLLAADALHYQRG
jgi:hypothetical protein